MAFRTLIVGLGPAGLGLHLRVLQRLRAARQPNPLFGSGPVVLWDPVKAGLSATYDGTVLADDLAEVARLTPPADTVVHLCTPPSARLGCLETLAAVGFRRFLVEKPLAPDTRTMEAIDALRREGRLELVVVAQWLDSVLSEELHRLVQEGEHGRLHELHFTQLKPRFSRTLQSPSHATALQVELPHSIGVALRLAGRAELLDARLTDMEVGETVVPYMGSAHVRLHHASGVLTGILSDLTAPVRERRVELRFGEAVAVGHYAVSQDDCYAHLELRLPGGPVVYRRSFPDDSLARFLTRSYQRLLDGDDLEDDFTLNVHVVRLLDQATRAATADGSWTGLERIDEVTNVR